MARKRNYVTDPHDFAEGDHVKVNQEAWWASVAQQRWTNPESDKRIAADTYRVVQAYPTNPFVAVVSDSTGKRMGLHVRVLIKMEEN